MVLDLMAHTTPTVVTVGGTVFGFMAGVLIGSKLKKKYVKEDEPIVIEGGEDDNTDAGVSKEDIDKIDDLVYHQEEQVEKFATPPKPVETKIQEPIPYDKPEPRSEAIPAEVVGEINVRK